MKLKCTTLIVVAILFTLFGTTATVAEQNIIRLATLEWEPYIGSKMPRNGLTAEIVAEAFKRVGYTVDIKFYPWTEAVKLGETGKVDGIFPAYHSKHREAHFLFSDPFAESARWDSYKISSGSRAEYLTTETSR
jgi:polar amino acid transport system substrate-binding protein